jgi:hypothetical protein
MNERKKPEYIEVEVFGHKFRELSGNAEDLITLEREGAIYSHFGMKIQNYSNITALNFYLRKFFNM